MTLYMYAKYRSELICVNISRACKLMVLSIYTCRSIKYLLKVENLVLSVSQLAQSHSITPLLTALSSSFLENHFSGLSPPQESSSDDATALNVLLSLIDEIQLEEPCVYQLVK